MSEATTQVQVNAYDAVPYRAYAYAFTHPRHLESMARLFDLQSPPIDHCRVLELGCAGGGNLIPQAIDLPESQFLGIDLSARQIEEGQQSIASLGLKNIELRHADIMDVNREWGQFDYIITHGVFSWIPPKVQERVLEICTANLVPNGVAFISYNTYPAWRLAEIVRDIMRYHTADFDKPEEKILQAKAILTYLIEAGGGSQVLRQAMQEELDLLKLANNDAYLFHEYLEADNRPMYFHEFMRLAGSKGLQYLADSEFSTMLLANMPEKARAPLQHLPAVQQEQYMDFVRNRRFRKTLLCHRAVAMNRRVQPAKMKEFHIALAGPLKQLDIDLRGDHRATIEAGTGRMESFNPLAKAAMLCLHDRYPEFLSFEDLHQTASARIAHLRPAALGNADCTRDALANHLLVAYTVDIVAVAVHPPRCVGLVSDSPLTSSLARWQAEGSRPITNQRHQTVNLDPLARRLLISLDGRHDRKSLVRHLQEAAAAGEVKVTQDDRSVAALTPAMCEILVDHSLAQMSAAGLLIG